MVRLHVLIPSYNCIEWIRRCLDSVKCQSSQPDQVLLIDDASTQAGYEQLASQLCEEYGYRYVRNSVNRKCPFNLRLGINLLDPDPEDVIFLLDGDDFLAFHALARVSHAYQDPDVWLTYGNYKPYPYDTGQVLAYAYPPEVIANRTFRTYVDCFNHPLTFRKFLWDGVSDADMQDRYGRWFTGAYDKVIISPMLEMAGDRFRFINETLYFYNAVNPASESHIHVQRIVESREIIQRPMKPRLERHAERC